MPGPIKVDNRYEFGAGTASLLWYGVREPNE